MRSLFLRYSSVAFAILSSLSLVAVGSVLQPTSAVAAPTTPAAGWTYTNAKSPTRTLVRDSNGALIATLTKGSRSVVIEGSPRTFTEGSISVRTASWVRLLPAAYTGTVDTTWLAAARADASPDVLAIATQYVTGAPSVSADDGSLSAADASYGPIVNGLRQEGADWNDFFGVTAFYDGVADRPETAQVGAIDCSGFVRMVFGHRLGFPMILTPDGVRLPRRATSMHTNGPGILLRDSSQMLPGDLVLFDAAFDDGAALDHVGIYMGKDVAGHPRFISSRKTADGPTFGDVGGRSTLDGTGLYASSLRAIRRL